MNKYEVRRTRLEQLIRERANGSQSQFAALIGRANSYVSRILYPEGKPGRKRIADDMIEHIETTLGLNRGWFDQHGPSGGGYPWPFTSISYEEYMLLDEFDKREIESALAVKAEKVSHNKSSAKTGTDDSSDKDEPASKDHPLWGLW